MQQLHLVGFTTDLEGLIFAARRGAKSGGFVVAIDDELLDAIDDAFERRGADDRAAITTGGGSAPSGAGDAERPMSAHRRAPRVESTLTPREIQARLRSGRSIREVAAAAGVDEDWVARFAAPIQAEQAQVVSRVRSVIFSKPRLGPSAQPLGVAVLWNLRDKGVVIYDDTFDEGWTACHSRDSEWLVRFNYVNRKKTQHAEWLVDLADGELIARNRLASELGYIEPGRRRRPPAPVGNAPTPPPEPPATGRGRSAAKATAKKAAKKAVKRPTKKATTKKATTGRSRLAKASGATKAATAKKPTARATGKTTAARRLTSKATAASRRPVAKKAATKKAATKKSGGQRAAAKRAPAKKAPAKKAPAARAGTRSGVPAAPASADRIAATTVEPSAAASRRERRARRIPPSTTPAPRVALNPVVATSPRRTFVPTPTGGARPAVVPTVPAGRPASTIQPTSTPAPPDRTGASPLPGPVEREARSEPARGAATEPPREAPRPAPDIVIDDADSSVRRISSRTQGANGDAVTIRAPRAGAAVPPPAPVSSRRFGRRRARNESVE